MIWITGLSDGSIGCQQRFCTHLIHLKGWPDTISFYLSYYEKIIHMTRYKRLVWSTQVGYFHLITNLWITTIPLLSVSFLRYATRMTDLRACGGIHNNSLFYSPLNSLSVHRIFDCPPTQTYYDNIELVSRFRFLLIQNSKTTRNTITGAIPRKYKPSVQTIGSTVYET